MLTLGVELTLVVSLALTNVGTIHFELEVLLVHLKCTLGDELSLDSTLHRTLFFLHSTF